MRKFIFNLWQLFLFGIRLFYVWLQGGTDCIVCGKKSFKYPVCKDCINNFFSVEKALSNPRCEYCGRELISTYKTCTSCRENRVLFNVDKIIPLFSYRLWNKELLFQWKITGVRNLSFFYASLVDKALKILGMKIIVPVPPRKGKISENGWDQIDELCKILKYKYGYEICNLLERNSSVQQKKLNRSERLETIKNAYSLRPYAGVLPESVCLIDDVCTTGSTIECCARLLKSTGIKQVCVITLYIVD